MDDVTNDALTDFAFNRTSVELKLIRPKRDVHMMQSFNRTSVELKLG